MNRSLQFNFHFSISHRIRSFLLNSLTLCEKKTKKVCESEQKKDEVKYWRILLLAFPSLFGFIIFLLAHHSLLYQSLPSIITTNSTKRSKALIKHAMSTFGRLYLFKETRSTKTTEESCRGINFLCRHWCELFCDKFWSWFSATICEYCTHYMWLRKQGSAHRHLLVISNIDRSNRQPLTPPLTGNNVQSHSSLLLSAADDRQ